jgi:hypothetical protein
MPSSENHPEASGGEWYFLRHTSESLTTSPIPSTPDKWSTHLATGHNVIQTAVSEKNAMSQQCTLGVGQGVVMESHKIDLRV